MVRIITIYIGVFIALTYGDYFTTDFAITNGAAQEFNPAVREGQNDYSAWNMVLINIGFLLATAGALYWAILNKSRIAEKYLNNPLRATFNYLYLNPFSEKNAPKSALHILAFAQTCLFAKIFAIISNTLVITRGEGLADGLMAILSPYLGGTPLFIAVTGIILTPIWILALYIAANYAKPVVGAKPREAAA